MWCHDGRVTSAHLRHWYAADADDLADALRADPELTRQFGGLDPDQPLGRGAVAAHIDRHLIPADGRLAYAVILADRVVGGVSVTGKVEATR